MVTSGFLGGTIYTLSTWHHLSDSTTFKPIYLSEFGLDFRHINTIFDLIRTKRELGIELTDAEAEIKDQRGHVKER